MTSRVAVLGLGRMGAAMATRLVERGNAVTAWTRSGRQIDGVPCAATAVEAVAGAGLVVLCLYDGHACRAVLEDARAVLSTSSIVVNTATVGPDEARELEQLVAAVGASYVHSPVMGSGTAAATGELTLLVGAGDLPEPTSSLLADLGTAVSCGTPTRAAAAKLIANGVLAGALLTVRDSLLRAQEKLGLDADLTWDVLERTLLGPLIRSKRPRLVSGDLTKAEFTVGALAKDVTLLAAHAPAAAPLRDEVARALLAADDDVAGLCAPPYGLTVAPDVPVSTEVIEPLRAYVAGHATGDADHHRRAFLPTARIEGLRDNSFVSWSVDDYCALFTGKPAPDEAMRRRRIDTVTVTGSTGTATMTLWHGDATFTDAFVLLRVDGAWRIANKAYHRARR